MKLCTEFKGIKNLLVFFLHLQFFFAWVWQNSPLAPPTEQFHRIVIIIIIIILNGRRSVGYRKSI